MLLGLERFEGASAPVGDADPVVREEIPARDPLDLISPEDEAAKHDLAHLGLVKGKKERDDLAVLGLARLFPRHRTKSWI